MDPNQATQQSSVPSPLSLLSGPDGKPLQSLPDSPTPRQMPSRRDKFNLVFMMFTLMTRHERVQLVKVLKAMRPRLDLMYPEGMKEGDIKNELTKAADEVVPDGEGDTEPEIAEVVTESSVPVQPEGDRDSVEVAAAGEEGGC